MTMSGKSTSINLKSIIESLEGNQIILGEVKDSEEAKEILLNTSRVVPEDN